jgi:hypothetical protein
LRLQLESHHRQFGRLEKLLHAENQQEKNKRKLLIGGVSNIKGQGKKKQKQKYKSR